MDFETKAEFCTEQKTDGMVEIGPAPPKPPSNMGDLVNFTLDLGNRITVSSFIVTWRIKLEQLFICTFSATLALEIPP